MGELLVVELEPGTLCCIHTCFPCRRLGLVGRAGEYRWWGEGGCLGAFVELWMSAMPVGGLLIDMTDPQYSRLVEGAAQDLHPKWEAVGAKPIANLQRRLAGDVGRGE